MYDFETIWRNRVYSSAEETKNEELIVKVIDNKMDDNIAYTEQLISDLKSHLGEAETAKFFCKTACHMNHSKIEHVKHIYEETNDLKEAHKAMEIMFKKDIKEYKQLSDGDVNFIMDNGWGAAGVYEEGEIIATKIPSFFHEYFTETDTMKKKYLYCHCPRVRKLLLQNKQLDSVYCNCGGGFYQDIWQYITGKEVEITVLKNLFDGDDVCQFNIHVNNE